MEEVVHRTEAVHHTEALHHTEAPRRTKVRAEGRTGALHAVGMEALLTLLEEVGMEEALPTVVATAVMVAEIE